MILYKTIYPHATYGLGSRVHWLHPVGIGGGCVIGAGLCAYCTHWLHAVGNGCWGTGVVNAGACCTLHDDDGGAS